MVFGLAQQMRRHGTDQARQVPPPMNSNFLTHQYPVIQPTYLGEAEKAFVDFGYHPPDFIQVGRKHNLTAGGFRFRDLPTLEADDTAHPVTFNLVNIRAQFSSHQLMDLVGTSIAGYAHH